MKPYYTEMPGCDLYLGDSALVLGGFRDNLVDLTVTSPPYDNLRTYNGFTFDFETIARELYRVTKPGGVVVWVVGDATVNGSETLTSFRQNIFFHDIGFNVHDTMIYEQAGTGAKGSNLGYWQTFEYMFVLSKGTPKTVNRIKDRKNITIGMKRGGRVNIDGTPKKEEQHLTSEVGIRSNIWRYAVGFTDSSDNVDHPAVFPEALAATTSCHGATPAMLYWIALEEVVRQRGWPLCLIERVFI